MKYLHDTYSLVFKRGLLIITSLFQRFNEQISKLQNKELKRFGVLS